MDRPPRAQTMKDQMSQGPWRNYPPTSTSAMTIEIFNNGALSKKKSKILHESQLTTHAEETYHDTITTENGHRLSKAIVDDVEANKAVWRMQNGPWDFAKDWGDKRELKSFFNLVKIKRGDDEIQVQPRIAFKWFLAIQSEKLDQELIKQEWIKLSATEKEEKMFDEIVWSDNRSCYCKKRKTRKTDMLRGEIKRENLDSLIVVMDNGQFSNAAKRKHIKVTTQPPTLIPHGLTEEEMEAKYILKLDEYGCVPLDGDWYWGLWSSPKTAEDKMKLSPMERAARRYCQRICIPVQYEGHKYMVGVETAFKLWLDKQTDPVIPREMLDEEYERIKGIRKSNSLGIRWGRREGGEIGYGTEQSTSKYLAPLHRHIQIKDKLAASASSLPIPGHVDGTLRLNPMIP